MAFTAVVVDLDGTVWDSFPWYSSLLANLSGESDSSISSRLAAGGNVMRLMREVGVTRARFVAACHQHSSELALFPAVLQTLQQIRDSGVSLGAMTSLPMAIAEPLCVAKNISPLLSAFEGAKFGRPAKPNPHGILDVLERMDVEPSSAVAYVGDMPSDAHAAERAGISFVWARYGYGQLHNEARIAEINAFGELLQL